MKNTFLAFFFTAFLSACFAQTLVKRSEMLVGKWKLYERGYLLNNKAKWVPPETRDFIVWEFKSDSTFTTSNYLKDSLTSCTAGRWKLEQNKLINLYDLKLVPYVPNVIALLFPLKIKNITDDELFVSEECLFVSNGNYIGKQPAFENGKDLCYYLYRRVK
jgi:hypothetical protein